MANQNDPGIVPVTHRFFSKLFTNHGAMLTSMGVFIFLMTGVSNGVEAPVIAEPAVQLDSSDAQPLEKLDPDTSAKVDGVGAPNVPPTQAPEPVSLEVAAGPDDITIEVDPTQSSNQDKSLPLAMLFSAALPGSGEYYLKEKGNAKAFLLVEAGFWASLYVAFMSRESYLSSARNFASDYAGIDAANKSPEFLETMANFRSYQEKQHRQDSYELAQILSGKRDGNYDIKAEEGNYWDFGSSVNPQNTQNWQDFQGSLRYYRTSKVAISFAVGALALNRLASLANTLRVYKRTSTRGLGIHITPDLGPETTGATLAVRF